MKPRYVLLIIASLLLTQIAFSQETVARRCQNSLMNLLHRLESGEKEPLEIFEFHHSVNTKEIFGGDNALSLAPVPLVREVLAVYRRPVVARGMRGMFSESRPLGDFTGGEFPKLLKPGARYTYVIDDQKIVFAESQPGVVRNMASKHALLRDQSENLRMAGEFWIDEDGVFNFDGGSGTFQPSNEVTSRALRFFRDQLGITDARVNFFSPAPGSVDAVDSGSPGLPVPN